jgi:hypothetical protein
VHNYLDIDVPMVQYIYIMTNPNSPIIRTSKTRDGKTAFLHEDGTVSNRMATFGFTTLNADVMHRFFDNIEAVLSADMPRAIKAANKGRLPFLPNEGLMDRESMDRVKRAELEIIHNRRVRGR